MKTNKKNIDKSLQLLHETAPLRIKAYLYTICVLGIARIRGQKEMSSSWADQYRVSDILERKRQNAGGADSLGLCTALRMEPN